MSAAAIELVVEEAVETTAEAAAEDAVENVVEGAVEEVVADNIEEAVQADVEQVIQNEVENAVEDVAEDAAENSAEQGMEQAVEQAQNSYWKQIFWEKIFPAMIAGISAGLVIEVVERSIDAATGKYDKTDDSNSSSGGSSSSSGSLSSSDTAGTSSDTADGSAPASVLRTTALFSQPTAKTATNANAASKTTQEKLLASKKLLAMLKDVTARWEAELQQYKDKNDAFGTFKFNRKYENANTTVAILFTNMKSDLEAASALAEQSNKENSWDDNITEFQWYFIDAVSRLLSVYKVKSASENMQKLGFPSEADKSLLQSELDQDFTDYKSIIKQMVQKHLASAAGDNAKTATQTAVEKIVKPPLEKEITKNFNSAIRPSALAQGKVAAKAEVTVVFNEWASRINKHAAIPIYGISTLKSWMKANIEPEAKRRAEEKALAAARATIQLPDAQMQMMKISKAAKDKVLKDYKSQIDKAASDAAKQAIEDVMKHYTNK